jgi:cytidylate kinase
MPYVITIGRQYGSGGRFIAQELARELNIKCYDNELLAKASSESGLSEHVFENYDEKKDGIFSGIIPTSYGIDMSFGQKVFLAQFETIKRLAQSENCVIVGRCADYVLRDNPNVVNVFITAKIDDRVERAIQYYNLDPKKAKDIILKMDKKRANYYNFYADKKWGKADSYDLTIDSSVGIKECVEIIKDFAAKKLKIKL